LTTKKTLLVLGGGEATFHYLSFLKPDYNIIIVDKSRDCLAYPLADDYIDCSIYNPDALISKIVDSKVNYNIDGVICLGTDAPLTAALVATKLGLQTVPIAAAKKTSNKILIKEVFSRVGVNTPNFLSADNKTKVIKFIKDQGLPVVIKPDDSRGSRGVGIAWNLHDIDGLLEDAKSFSSTGTVLIERFLDGQQVSTESIIYKGVAYTPGFSDRNYEFLSEKRSNVIENGGDLPASLDQKTKDQINFLIQKLADALNIKDGIIKGDVIIHDEKIYFLEIALRLSGGYFSSHKIPYSTGVDMLQIAARICTRQEVDLEMFNMVSDKPVSQRFLFPQDGHIKSYEKDSLGIGKNIIFSNVFIPETKNTNFPKDHTTRLGCVIATGINKEEAVKNAEDYILNIDLKY